MMVGNYSDDDDPVTIAEMERSCVKTVILGLLGFAVLISLVVYGAYSLAKAI